MEGLRRTSAGADDPWWLEPCPDATLDPLSPGPDARYDARESITLSFVAGLQRLPARQRAVFLLRDVLGFSTDEAADLLDASSGWVDRTLVQARDAFRPDRGPDAAPAPRSEAEAAVVARFVDAFQSGEVHRVVQVLSDDARLSMPPGPIRCDGPSAIASYLQSREFWGPRLSLIPTRANGQPAFGYYLPTPEASSSDLRGLIVLTITDDRVSTITRFGGDVIHRFGLPASIDRD